MKLRRDIYGTVKSNVLYGASGTEVKMIADHGNVKIVEDRTGFRFSVKNEDLVDDRAPVDASVKIDTSYKKVHRQQKKAAVIEHTLFS